MGSSLKPKSTRARPARSAKSVHNARRKPTRHTPGKVRTAADALRAIKHARSTGAAEQLRVSPTQALREIRDGVPATELRHICKKLELIQSVAIVVAHALREQNVELDDDAADVLRRHVSDELQEQIESIDSLVGGDE